MSYISGTTSQDAKIIVLDSNNNTLAASSKNTGTYKIDKFGDTLNGTTESGTVVAVSTTGETLSYNKVQFAQEDDLPPTPWTETFTGPDTQYATNHMWSRTHVAPYVGLLNNKLRINPANSTYNFPYNKSDFLLWGNFDISVNLDLITAPATNGWYFFIRVKYEPAMSGTGSYFQVRRKYGTAHGFTVASSINGTTAETTQINSTLTSTKLRIARYNNRLYGYYWNGSAWASITNIDFTTAREGGHAPVSVELGGSTFTGYPNVVADFDNFTTNACLMNYRYVESFTGYSNGSSPDSNFFDPTVELATIQSEKLSVSTSASVSRSATKFKYPLKGDFYVLCSYNMSAAPSSGLWHAQFKATIDDNNYIAMKRQYWSGVHYITGVSRIDGAQTNDNTTSNNTGYYMLSRLGTTVDAYYSIDSSTWTLLHTRTSFPTDDLYIQFDVFYTSGTPVVTCEFDNFKIVNKPFNDLKVKFPINSTA